jgi:hypothetical protein
MQKNFSRRQILLEYRLKTRILTTESHNPSVYIFLTYESYIKIKILFGFIQNVNALFSTLINDEGSKTFVKLENFEIGLLVVI